MTKTPRKGRTRSTSAVEDDIVSSPLQAATESTPAPTLDSLRPEVREALDFLTSNMRIELTGRREGGTGYFDSPPRYEMSVTLKLGDDVICHDSDTIPLD